MKLLTKFKQSMIDNLQFTVTEMAKVQSELSKALWPDRRERPKRKVAGYYPPGYILPRSITETDNQDIRFSDNEAGYSWFSALSRGDKTKYIFRKFFPVIPELYVPSKSNRGSWYIPCFSSSRADLQLNVRANRYLAHQERRIKQAIDRGDYELSTRIWTILAQRSWCFRVSSINSTKCTKNWYYAISKSDVMHMLTRIDNIMRTWSCNAKFFRVYIPKADGIRFRPLGAPSKPWAVILHMLHRYLVLVVQPHISDRQFGFLPKRNGVQAWRKILALRKEGYVHMYEFDLDGCFNRISVAWTLKLLKDIGLPSYFVYYLENVLTALPIANVIKEEVELTQLRTMVVKSGLPQGFNVSPLLSILVINAAFKSIGLDPVLYADDGLIMSKERKDLTREQISMLAHWGLVLSSKKKKDGSPSCRWIDDEFTFLNITYSISRDAFRVETSPDRLEWVRSKDMTDDMFWKDLEIYAGTVPWSWKIDPKCISLDKRNVAGTYNWLLMKRWIEGSPMVQRCGLMFMDVQKESSFASRRILLRERRRVSNSAIKKIRMEDKYAPPLTWLHKIPLPLPNLIQTHSEVRDYLPRITRPLSKWLNIDLAQRKHLYCKLYGNFALSERNISGWRDNSLLMKWMFYEDHTKSIPRWYRETSSFEYLPPRLSDPIDKNTVQEAIAEMVKQNNWQPGKVDDSQGAFERRLDLLKEKRKLSKDSRIGEDRVIPYSATRHVNSPKPIIFETARNTLARFTSSFLITLFLLDKLGKAFLPPLVLPGETECDSLPWCWDEVIGWLLISLAIFLFFGIWCWYIGIIKYPSTRLPDESSPLIRDFNNTIEELSTANNSLTLQVRNLTNANQELEQLSELKRVSIESLTSRLDTVTSRLEFFDKLNVSIQGKLDLIKQTLLIVRQENLNLNSQLKIKFTEFERTNNLLDITRTELERVSDRLDELMFTLDATDHGIARLADGVNTLFVECPAIQMLHQVGQFTTLDISAARMITSTLQNGDEVLVFANDSISMNIINGLGIIRDFMIDHPDVTSISDIISYW